MAVGISAGMSACTSDGKFQPPWNPRAEMRVLDIASSETGRFVGIRQSAEDQGAVRVLVYTYVEPVVKFEVLAGFPNVNFTKFSSRITLADGTILPTKEYPLSKGTSQAGEFSVQFPIMGSDRDLQNVVFPGNNAPRVRDGKASIILYGKDLNGYSIELPFTVSLSFESTVFSDSPLPPSAVTTPTPTPSASNSGGR